jgi:adenine-specific DNA-methyltransferase
MPTLNWIGKEVVVEHHRQVPFHLLRCDPELSVGEPGSGNLLVQGDNLLALKALLPYYKGQVKCIYIDPPYNTGNESWVYNDNVNSPEINEWLGKVVGGEAEDLSRHDKWLCMMYPRLVLLRELLSENGAIFVQIGDEETAHLRLLLDEVFGRANYRNSVIVRRGTKNVQSQFETIDSLAVGHDTVLIYTKSSQTKFPKLQHDLGSTEAGKWDTFWRGTDRPTMRYELFGITPETGQWRWSKKRALQAVENYELYLSEYVGEMSLDEFYVNTFVSTGEKMDFVRLGSDDTVQYYVPPRSYKLMSDVWMDARTRGTFAQYPTEKHTELLKRLIRWITSAEEVAIILDSFAGSGTTGHAVLKLNQEDGGDRRFILVEMEPEIARAITSERLKRAIEGYEWEGRQGQVNREEGLGSGFRFCELGPTLFDAQGQIRDEVSFADLAHHVFFTETGEPLPPLAAPDSPFLGTMNGVAVYMLYNGILKDKSADGGNVLTQTALSSLPSHDGPKVIYGNGCMLSAAYLQQEDITFRQIPYEIKIR